jgi:cytochrome c oxidase subunit 2
MLATVVVHPDQASFDAWSGQGVAPDGSLLALGEQVFAKRGCAGCHSLDGTRRVGPSLKGLWGAARTLADGSSVKADEDYLRESLVKPGAKLVAGFPNAMPPVALAERDLQALVVYLKSLSEAP